MHLPKPYRTYPLRATLVAAVITIVVVVIAILLLGSGLPAYGKAKKEVRALWEEIAKQETLMATEQILRYFENAPITVKVMAGLVEESQLSIDNTESIFDVCYRVLKENPDFATVYYVTKDRTFFGLLRMPDGEFEASYRQVEAPGKTVIKNYRIGDDNKWIQKEELIGEYDPEKRPYWKTAIDHPEGGWTDPYRFATTKVQGYTYILGQRSPIGIAGYWAIDFQTNGLAAFLKQLHLGNQGVAFIIAQNGSIISQSDEGNIPHDLPNEWQALGKRIFYTRPLPQESGIPWKVVVSIHENDFLNPIRMAALTTLLYGLIPTFLFLVATALFLGKISRRLIDIAWEMDEAGHLAFSHRSSDEVLSRIREINVMNHSLIKMKIGLASFAKYIPVKLVKRLLFSKKAATLGAERKLITVLFADLSHFTTTAEQKPPEESVQILERFLTLVSAEVHKEQGIIDKFIGDAVMALWGAPEPVENSALAACRTALRLKDACQSHPQLQHKIGINTGPAMVGNFGSEDRLDYTAIGDTVNVAARLEKLNKQLGTQILIGPETAAAVADQMIVKAHESVLLEGRTAPIQVFELLGEKANHS